MSSQPQTPGQISETVSSPRYYRRFSPGQTLLHAVVVTTFLGLALTGLPLRFSTSPWAEGFAHAVGGFAAILFFHKLCAVTLTVAFLGHVGHILCRGLIRREKGIFWGPTSMVPRWKDFKDLFGNFRWFLGLGPRPRFERYAYWEKFDYWAVFWGMVIIGFSGYAMWFAPLFARFLPGWALNAALIVHGHEALLAVLFIFAIHFFNTHLRPESFPMDMVVLTGRETEEEFSKKRALEFSRLASQGMLESKVDQPPSSSFVTMTRIAGFVAVAIGLTLLVLTLMAYFSG
jgi:cytochrome b subunit of formate dehydrogenase